ncbi:hypothetical protein GCM10017673_47780 [Streptosporangium violaceochromogenes]|nr:hypothetical protein GCM10017673_47780 [Streptosporangium violaceochromogenes]
MMRAWIAAHGNWSAVYWLLACAPELNLAEGVWSNLRTKLFNFTASGIDKLAGLIKSQLKLLQYRLDLLNGFISETGMMTPDPA